MSTIAEIENALRKLPVQDARAVADWLELYLDELWDKQIEAESKNEHLDHGVQKPQADIARDV